MIKCIIIDDEPLARLLVLEYLQQYTDIEVVAECSDGFEGVKKVEELKPDLIFLDIQMPKISGFEMLELLDHKPGVIFATAFDEYALKAFDLHALDYLLKPFSAERFAQAIDKWRIHKQGTQQAVEQLLHEDLGTNLNNNRVIVKVKDKIKIIPAVEIFYIEASGDFVKIVTTEGTFLKSRTMSYFENLLDQSQFIRIHRSYLLNINELTRLELYEKDSYLAILKSGSKLPISKTGYTKLKSIIGI